MFDPARLPLPDSYGFFCHPDVPGQEEHDDVARLCRNLGYDLAKVAFEDDASLDLLTAYFEEADPTAVSRWSPTAPAGSDWLLVAKYDTEDGPWALFVQKIVNPVCGQDR